MRDLRLFDIVGPTLPVAPGGQRGRPVQERGFERLLTAVRGDRGARATTTARIDPVRIGRVYRDSVISWDGDSGRPWCSSRGTRSLPPFAVTEPRSLRGERLTG